MWCVKAEISMCMLHLLQDILKFSTMVKFGVKVGVKICEIIK